jgi:hypothetical protein
MSRTVQVALIAGPMYERPHDALEVFSASHHVGFTAHGSLARTFRIQIECSSATIVHYVWNSAIREQSAPADSTNSKNVPKRPDSRSRTWTLMLSTNEHYTYVD